MTDFLDICWRTMHAMELLSLAQADMVTPNFDCSCALKASIPMYMLIYSHMSLGWAKAAVQEMFGAQGMKRDIAEAHWEGFLW